MEPIAKEFKPEVVDERPQIVKEQKRKVVMKKEGIEQSNVVGKVKRKSNRQRRTLSSCARWDLCVLHFLGFIAPTFLRHSSSHSDSLISVSMTYSSFN